MKAFYFFGILSVLAFSCAQNKEVAKTSALRMEENQDSTEYKLIIIDNNFDLWYKTNYSPAKDHTNEYYWNKNIVAAGRWDEYYRNGKYDQVVDSFLDYKPHIDYGIEVNRKLFWYFKFVQEYYNIPLYY